MNQETKKESILKAFQKIRVPVEITDQPLAFIERGRAIVEVDNSSIFQMSIESKSVAKRKPPTEYFRLWLGAEDNNVRVLDVDSKQQQLLLLVKEPKRKFKRRATKYGIISREKREGLKVEEEIVLITDDSSRKYLMGMDEKHLFVCQIPEKGRVVNKVAEAHRDLKPKETRGTKEKRQGEFFFLEVDNKEINEIDEKIKCLAKDKLGREIFRAKNKSLNTIMKKLEKGAGSGAYNFHNDGLGPRGNPHIAENILVKDKEKIYVKGKIRHPEHSTINLLTWHRVYKNAEVEINANRDKLDIKSTSVLLKWVD